MGYPLGQTGHNPFMILYETIRRRKTCRKHHADSPTKLLNQIQANIRATDKSHSNQRVFVDQANRLLPHAEVQLDPFADGSTDALVITGLASIKQDRKSVV